MIKKNKGCLCENLAVVWLQEQGYYVFKDKRVHILSVDLQNKKCRIVPKRKAIWN
jgi:hypothetical protein